MTMPLDEKGHDASTQALLDAFPMADKIAAMYAEVAIRAYLSAVALPDELEVAGWVMGSSFTTDPLMADYWGKAAKAVTGSDQAHSTIAALRAEIVAADAEQAAWRTRHSLMVKRAETVEAEVKRLTEENEALRAELQDWQNGHSKSVRAHAEALARVEALEEALRPFVVYAPEACFLGNGKWTPVQTMEAGGGWVGSEDFRAARATLNSREKAE